jgi:putative oxidoreductase
VTTFFFRRQGWYLLARLILGGAFVYAGILKIRSPLEFADNIAAYQLLPASMINVLALGLPFLEIVGGLSVLGGVLIRIGTLGILALLIVFIGAIVEALEKGLSIDCGCFGGHSGLESNLWVALGRNLVLLLLAAFIYRHGFLQDEKKNEANTQSDRLER